MFCTFVRNNILYKVSRVGFGLAKAKKRILPYSKFHHFSQAYCTKIQYKNYNLGYENSFAYQTVEKLVKYPTKQLHVDADEILKESLKSDLNEETKKNIAAKLKGLSNEDLVILLQNLASNEDRLAIKDLVKIIDYEGSLRVPKGQPSVMLAGAIQMFVLQLHFKSDWLWACLNRFCRRLNALSSSEVLQVMFLLNIARKIPQQYSGFDVQHGLVNHIDNFSLDELALVSIAFFKTQTKMNSKVIMSKLMRKLLNEADSCGSVSIGLLCKNIKYSLPVELSDELMVLQDRLIKEVPRIALRSLTHVAAAGTNVLVCHELLIRSIIDRVRNVLSEVRLKDLERLTFVLSLYNLRDDDFVDRVVKELEGREDEIVKYPKAFVSLVNYLIVLENYQDALIDRVLSYKFINDTYYLSFKKIGSELIFIDKSVEIERPQYNGNRLTEKMMKTSAKIMTFSSNATLTGTQRFSYELEDVLTQLYGKKNFTFISLVPHFHFPDFIMRFGPDWTPQSIPQEMRTHQWGDVKRAPDDGCTWLSLLVGGWNTVVRNTEEPLGTTLAKMRQLRILGFHPFVVPFFTWRRSTDKQSYLSGIIDQERKNICVKRKVKAN